MKVAVILLFTLGVAAVFYVATSRETHTVFEPSIQAIEPASPCPWRDADQDMTNWFPGATKYLTEDTVLSGQRTELRAQLGRELHSEEMALHTYQITSNNVHLGTVLTRRIKADHGAIELAMAVDDERKLKALKIQRIREPEAIVDALEKYELERRFAGLSATSDFAARLPTTSGGSNEALEIARNIASGVKATLILYDAGQTKAQVIRHH